MVLVSIAQAIIDRISMQTFDPIRGTRGLIATAPVVDLTVTVINADRITTGRGIITTGRKSTTSKFFRRPCCYRRCRHFSGRMIKLGCETFHYEAD